MAKEPTVLSTPAMAIVGVGNTAPEAMFSVRFDRHRLSAAARTSTKSALAMSQNLQDLPTRSQWFFYASWQDVLVTRLSLAGFWRQDMQTNSRATWLEARYAWESVDLALQWQAFGGSAGTVYFAAPEKQTLQLVLRLYI